ncbi:hypothetical protein C8F01DRAFT_1045834 [Mycena amicta]|nr:hypothetical protein C8F01DRAFT_1045834 [Mycena amicta]
MALPATVTVDFTGKYTLNKELSNYSDFESIMEHQGVGMLKRKAVGMMSGATQEMKIYTDADGVEHLDVTTHVTGMSADKEENRVLNWTEKTLDHPLFGAGILAKSRRCKVEELDEEYLQKGWTNEYSAAGVIHLKVTRPGDKGWTVNQAWGVEEINGEKRHTRRFAFSGPKGKTIHARIVYNYVGPL